jgi:hypothetical protein
MVSDHLSQSGIESLPVLVENHSVGVAVQLLKAESRVVLALDLLESSFFKHTGTVNVRYIGIQSYK